MRFRQWSTSADLQLYTDASSEGFGAYFGGRWFAGRFSDIQTLSDNICWKELYVLVAALATWSQRLTRRKIMVHSDNISVVAMVKSGTSRLPQNMALLRALFYVCAEGNFDVTAQHIPGAKNILADLLSRNRVSEFKATALNAASKPDPISKVHFVF
jgi:hypothetical protein